MLFFKDITVELASRDGCFPTDISHLALELNQNGRVVSKVNLLSRESSPGIWDADEPLILLELTGEFTLSVLIPFNENEGRVVGYMEVDGTGLWNRIGVEYEILLLSHENYLDLTLRTKIRAMENIQENIGELISGITQQPSELKEGGAVQRMFLEGVTAYEEFERNGNLERLEQAISSLQAVANVTVEDDTKLHVILDNLGTFLLRRFEQLGRIADIDESIEKLERATALTGDDGSERLGYLCKLGNALRRRFERSGKVEDIDKGIMHQQAAVSLTPDGHPDKPMYLNNLGSSLQTRFERFGKAEDLDQAIMHKQGAVNVTPDGHPDKPMYLNNLGNSLEARFQRSGKAEDLDQAIMHSQVAVNLTPDGHPDKPVHLNNLGSSLETRFEQFGKAEDLDRAIIHKQSAVNLTPDGHPHKLVYLSNLGISLQTRFEQFGKAEDLDRAIIHKRAVVSLTPDGHPHKPVYLNNLGNSLRTRFEQFGKAEDLDQAIMHEQGAVNLTPDGHTSKPMRLSNLGLSLRTRFQRFGKAKDLDQAIMHEQVAVHLTPDGHPKKSKYLNNLAISLETRFQQFGKAEDVNQAIMHEQAAVNLTPDGHPKKPKYLSNLGISLQLRFEGFGKAEDLDQAIMHEQAAFSLTPDGHPDKPMCLSNLGSSLQTRFEQFGRTEDLDQAIIHKKAAVNLTPGGHPNKTLFLKNLGNAFRARFLHFRDHKSASLAIMSYSASAESLTGSPTKRFDAVQNWISMASLTGHDSLLSAYECALSLMPLVAWLGLSIPDRHEHLVKIGSIARDAAATAISVDQWDRAVEWLEQGRSIVWNQILQLRTPVDELRIIDTDLADRLMQVSRLLNQGIDQNEERRSIEEEGRRYRALATEWQSIVEQVRSLPNFEDFLRPVRIYRLRDAAKDGPVVIFNIAEERCDALTLVPGIDKVIHIPLPNITSKRVTVLRDEFRSMLYSSGIRMRGDRATERLKDEEGFGGCKPILAELWTGLVKPVLDSLAFSPKPDVFPRIWRCATGPMAFLPIHAAGIYGDESTGSQVGDYVISSYTPTLSSLLPSTEPAPDASFKLLSVIQPSAPGVSHIPNTKQELECIKNHLGDRYHIILESHEGTKERVMKAMEKSNWIHLACHGSQRQDEPTKSGLILEDGHLTLEEIIKLDLPNAEFAFLSACQTTTGEETLSDEAVHIAGGMLLAGYKGVVATMWSIQDDLAPKVADEFYRHIMGDQGRPDSRKAAEALHYSIRKLWKKGDVPLTSWIPFVHLGM